MAKRRVAGEGTVRKRTDGRWEAMLPRAAAPGGVRTNFTGRTRDDVVAKLRAALQHRDEGRPVANTRQTTGEFLEQWLVGLNGRDLRWKTAETYRGYLRHRVIPALASVPLAQLGPQHVDRLLAQLKTAGMAPRSVQHCRGILRNALNDAQRWGLVTRNAAALARVPKVTERQVTAVGPAEARQILDAIAGDPREQLYAVTLALGLRQSEVLGLRWADLDLDGGTLSVARTLQYEAGAYCFEPPKTERSRRTVPLPAPLVERLRLQHLRKREERLRAGTAWAGERWGGLVFANAIGAPLAGREVTRRFQRLLAAAGLPRMRFHDLRHAAATVMLTLGVAPRVVMETLGHSQISTTMDRYSHVTPELHQAAADRVGAALFG